MKKLENVEFTAGVKISSGTPGSGKVLTSDGSGNGTWQTATGIDATFGTLTYASPTTTWAFDNTAPNKSLAVSGDTSLNLTGTANGDRGILKITKTAGTETLTLPGSVYGTVQSTAGAIDYIHFLNDNGTIRWFVEMSNKITTEMVTTIVTNSTTTAAKITELDEALTPGAYSFQYNIIYQSSITTTGIKFSVNYTGTVTSIVGWLRYVDVSATASTGAPSQAANASTAQVMGAYSFRAASTAAGIGPTLSVDAANSNMLAIIEGVLLVSTAGNIELYHASETAAATSVRPGTGLTIIKNG